MQCMCCEFSLAWTFCFALFVQLTSVHPLKKSSFLYLLIYLSSSLISPENLLNTKLTFFSSVSPTGDIRTFPGDCVSKWEGLHGCLSSKRARDGHREAYRVPLTDGDYSRRPSLRSSFGAHALLCKWARENEPWLFTYNLPFIIAYLWHNILDANALWMHIKTQAFLQSITRTSYTNLHNLITYCITSEHHSPAMLWYFLTHHNQWNIQGNCVILYKQMCMQIIGVIVRELAEGQHGRVC